ncbi:MAG: DNA polymerase IV, partial [Caulobacteraceae bacterium]|nr:DNA polymerase IV [Caulobacter sp.]
DFRQVTRSRTGAGPVSSREALGAAGRDLVRTVLPLRAGVRLIGLAVSGFEDPAGPADPGQLSLPL